MFSRAPLYTALLIVSCLTACNPASQKNAISNSCLKAVPVSVFLEAGSVVMGSETGYPEERPLRRMQIAPFDIDATEVTNQQFSVFVKATGYVTEAEKPQAGFGTPGGAVFTPPTARNSSWWQFVEGANWRHPEGPESSIDGKDLHPVVQVTLGDARAYARWAGRRIPTEAEWEYAAKAGAKTGYIGGNEHPSGNQEKANTWQGVFPFENTASDGYLNRAPIGCFEANNFRLYDMIGNVWEWTETEWGDNQSNAIKGGSFLCAENYCRRYTPSARQPQEHTLSTNHVGFRTVKSSP